MVILAICFKNIHFNLFVIIFLATRKLMYLYFLDRELGKAVLLNPY